MSGSHTVHTTTTTTYLGLAFLFFLSGEHGLCIWPGTLWQLSLFVYGVERTARVGETFCGPTLEKARSFYGLGRVEYSSRTDGYLVLHFGQFL
jgi:hypothetical protein